QQDDRQNVEPRSYGRMEVYTTNPGGNSHADTESDDCPHGCQGCASGRKEPSNQPSRRTQGLHDGKVATAIKDPSDQGREDTQCRGCNDENSCRCQGCAGFSQHPRFTFHDLTNGTNLFGGKGL